MSGSRRAAPCPGRMNVSLPLCPTFEICRRKIFPRLRFLSSVRLTLDRDAGTANSVDVRGLAGPAQGGSPHAEIPAVRFSQPPSAPRARGLRRRRGRPGPLPHRDRHRGSGQRAERAAHPGCQGRHHHLHPARRAGPARHRHGHADDGLPRRGQLPRRPQRPRPARPAAGRVEGAVRVPRGRRHQPGGVRRLRAERRQPRWHGVVPRRRQRGRPGGVPRLCPHAARLPRRQRARGDRQPRQHPDHLVRPEQRRAAR